MRDWLHLLVWPFDGFTHLNASADFVQADRPKLPQFSAGTRRDGVPVPKR
ncbi:MAG: hypothetical protein M9918_25865 [Anaerolineae bacterium]|nr:hypothetical protein [Anaerolineae bacterium]